MKIVITVEEFDPDKGYMEYYLATELTRLGHQVYVFTFGCGKGVLRTKLEEGFEVFRIPPIATAKKYHIPSLNGVACVNDFVKLEKPDIVHCQPLFSPLSLLFFSFQRLSNYKIVGSLVTGSFSIDKSIQKVMYHSIKIIVEQYVKRKTELIFAVSREIMEIVARSFNIQPHEFCIIPLGADPAIFNFNPHARKEVRELLGLNMDDVLVVYSGKIAPSKGLDVLIKAYASIMTQNPKAKLLIVGAGDPAYLEYLERLISRFEIAKNVIFHPWVHRSRLSAFYSASDIGVWPGSTSISIIEAASVGLPVILERSPLGIFKLEYRNGFLFEGGNINDLRKYLEILINNGHLREDMGHKSRLLVEEKLNWRQITSRYLEAYQKALKPKLI